MRAPLVRLLTAKEREERAAKREAEEVERTKDFTICACCERKRPPGEFPRDVLRVCHNCRYLGSVYGRSNDHLLPHQSELHAAMAVIRALRRTKCLTIRP